LGKHVDQFVHVALDGVACGVKVDEVLAVDWVVVELEFGALPEEAGKRH